MSSKKRKSTENTEIQQLQKRPPILKLQILLYSSKNFLENGISFPKDEAEFLKHYELFSNSTLIINNNNENLKIIRNRDIVVMDDKTSPPFEINYNIQFNQFLKFRFLYNTKNQLVKNDIIIEDSSGKQNLFFYTKNLIIIKNEHKNFKIYLGSHTIIYVEIVYNISKPILSIYNKINMDDFLKIINYDFANAPYLIAKSYLFYKTSSRIIIKNIFIENLFLPEVYNKFKFENNEQVGMEMLMHFSETFELMEGVSETENSEIGKRDYSNHTFIQDKQKGNNFLINMIHCVINCMENFTKDKINKLCFELKEYFEKEIENNVCDIQNQILPKFYFRLEFELLIKRYTFLSKTSVFSYENIFKNQEHLFDYNENYSYNKLKKYENFKNSYNQDIQKYFLIEEEKFSFSSESKYEKLITLEYNEEIKYIYDYIFLKNNPKILSYSNERKFTIWPGLSDSYYYFTKVFNNYINLINILKHNDIENENIKNSLLMIYDEFKQLSFSNYVYLPDKFPNLFGDFNKEFDFYNNFVPNHFNEFLLEKNNKSFIIFSFGFADIFKYDNVIEKNDYIYKNLFDKYILFLQQNGINDPEKYVPSMTQNVFGHENSLIIDLTQLEKNNILIIERFDPHGTDYYGSKHLSKLKKGKRQIYDPDISTTEYYDEEIEIYFNVLLKKFNKEYKTNYKLQYLNPLNSCPNIYSLQKEKLCTKLGYFFSDKKSGFCIYYNFVYLKYRFTEGNYKSRDLP